MNEKSKLLFGPNNGTKVSTVHETRVVESPFLPSLRVRAYKSAGFTGEFSGSVENYKALPSEDRESIDEILSGLVKENLDLLQSNAHDHAVIEVRPIIPNLALDQGLNNLMTTIPYSDFNNVACAGTGTTPTFIDSSAITATASGTTVTSSAGFFTSGMNGWLIQFNSGEQRYITFVDTTHATIDSSLTIGSATLFTVYGVNQTGLDTEVKRTHVFLNGTGNTGTSDASGVRTYKVTHDFSAEVSNTNYSELGWSNLTGVGSNLNARSLVSGGTVTVLIGQQLRTIHQLAMTPGPVTSTSGTYSITGWPVAPATDTNGNYMIPGPFISDTYGFLDTGGGSGGGINDVGVVATAIKLATGSTLPAPNNAFVPGTSQAPTSTTRLSYTTNSFFRDVESFYDLNTANATNWRSAYTDSTFGASGFAFVFGQAQTKDNTHTLRIRVRYSVSRILVNP